jgi:peptidoglycan/LPS O-acetylase OafA/YrhL
LITRFFNFSPLRFLGKISYGFYIFHWPIYLAFRQPLTNWASIHLPSLPAKLTCSLFATLLGLLLSVISYNYFEKYFNTLKSRFAGP